MKNTEHTPGPWRTLSNAYIGQWQILSAQTKVATVSKRNVGAMAGAMAEIPEADSEAGANARLIAAAPELLAALEACKQAAEDTSKPPSARMELVRDFAVPAIAQAKGRTVSVTSLDDRPALKTVQRLKLAE